MMKLILVAVVQLLCLQFWWKDRLLSEGTHTQSLTVVKRIVLHREQVALHMERIFTLCRMRCANAGFWKHDCSRKCPTFLKSGRSSFVRKRRSYNNNGQTKRNFHQNQSRSLIPGYGNSNWWVLPPNVNSSNFNLTFSQSMQPPKSPPELRDKNHLSKSCQNTFDQTISNSLSPSRENKSLPLFVNVTFSGGDHEQWKAVASWKYNVTAEKRTRNITGFMVYWHSDSFKSLKCRKLPQNQTMIKISTGDGWMYPEVLHLAVKPIPTAERKHTDLTAFFPTPSFKTPSTTQDNKLSPIPTGVTAISPTASYKIPPPSTTQDNKLTTVSVNATASFKTPLTTRDNKLTPVLIGVICAVITVVVLVSVLFLILRHSRRSESTQSLGGRCVYIVQSRR